MSDWDSAESDDRKTKVYGINIASFFLMIIHKSGLTARMKETKLIIHHF